MKSTNQIGKLSGSHSTIQRWLLKFDIPLRKGAPGRLNGMYGKHHTKRHKDKISKIMKNKSSGENNPFYGHHHTEETKRKWNRKKENHPNWQGGIGKEPYPFDFNEELKELIRKRDGYVCQLCGKIQDNLKRKLSVHHIDYNKENLDSENLLSLCLICNPKVNYNRNHWYQILKENCHREKNVG